MLYYPVTRAYTPIFLRHVSQTNLLCTRDRIFVLPYPNLTSLQPFPGEKNQQGPRSVNHMVAQTLNMNKNIIKKGR